MNERSIRQMRRKFILVSAISYVAVMLLISGLLYASNLIITRMEIRSVLSYIADNNGFLDETEEYDPADDGEYPASGEDASETAKDGAAAADTEALTGETGDSSEGGSGRHTLRDLTLRDLFYSNLARQSKEFSYTTRYFAVIFDEDGSVRDVQTSHIAAVSRDDAIYYAQLAQKRFFRFGTYGVYYYLVRGRDDGSTIVVFLDSTSEIATSNRLLYLAMILIFVGSIITILLLRIHSWKIIQPEIRAAKRQKQFITNASHELKTPLAVIRANTEVEQMINGENEWNQSTMRQVERMTGLINNLVMIVRAQEQEGRTQRTTIDISKAVSETVQTFRPVAGQDQKTLTENIASPVSYLADESQIRQLASLLIDNAIKYCDEGGEIHVALSQRGRTVRLEVSNAYADGAGKDYSRFFDRFYRQDASHNTERGGYGIGLSIAESLVQSYNGTISAAWKDGVITFTCVLR